MAKGKHAPAPGAIRKDKVIHPKSRKAGRIQSREQRRSKLASQAKVGGQKLQALGEKLVWFKDNLQFCLPDDDEGDGKVDRKVMLTLTEAFLTRFDEELEQIKLKNSIGGGGKNKRSQHGSRLDVIEHAMKLDREEFEGCGLEMPDLLDKENCEYFRSWEGELRYAQNIKLRRFRRSELVGDTDCQEVEQERPEMDVAE